MRGSKRILPRAVMSVAMIVGAGLIAARAYEGLTTTRKLVTRDATTAAAGAYREFSCLEAAFRLLVPQGSSVFLAIDDALLLQRTVSAAFPDRRVVSSPEDADLVVQLQVPSAPALCDPQVFSATPGGDG